MSLFTQSWKLFPLAGASALPITGLYFFSKEKFNWNDPKGVNAHVKLFVINDSGSSGSTLAASLTTVSGGGSSQVSAETAASNGKSSDVNNLALVSKIPIDSIEKFSSWEYCLPSSSSLNSNLQPTQQSQVSTDGSICELKNWSGSSVESSSKNSTNNDTIKYLFELISKYIRLQHQVNMIYLFHSENKEHQAGATQASSENESWKKVKIECGFIDSSISDKKSNLARQMLLTTTDQSKKCMPFPFLVSLYLKLKSGSETQTTDTSSSTPSITKEKIKGGELWGQISYGLTDYWGNVKQINKNVEANSRNGQDSPLLIDVPIVLNYDLSNSSDNKDSCKEENAAQNGVSKSRNFDYLWKKYEEKSLRLCDYFQSKNSKKDR